MPLAWSAVALPDEGYAWFSLRDPRVLAGLVEGHGLVVTHGNGPQVGLLARQNEALAGADPVPFDVLVAENAFLSMQYLTQVKKSLSPALEACNFASALS